MNTGLLPECLYDRIDLIKERIVENVYKHGLVREDMEYLLMLVDAQKETIVYVDQSYILFSDKVKSLFKYAIPNMERALSKDELCLHEPYILNNAKFVSEVVAQLFRSRTFSVMPRKLDIIVDKLYSLCEKEFDPVGKIYCRAFEDYDDILKWLKIHLMTIPEIREINLQQCEYDAGERDVDGDRPFFESGGQLTKETEFIDLDAFVNNVCQGLISRCVCIDYSTF